MSRRNRIIIIAAIVMLAAIIALYPVARRALGPADTGKPVRGRGSQSAASQQLSVNAMVLKYDTLEDLFIVTGIINPDEEVDLSFETSGKITEIYFKEGTSVRKGELLAKVNDTPLQAELRKLESQLPLAQDRVYRQQSLLEKDAVSQESYESVATDLETLRADIELVKARIAQTELRAPFDGVIGLRHVSEGTYASPTTIVSSLTKISPLKIEFSVNEKQAGELTQGKKLNFTVDNDMNIYSATVYAMESRLDESTLSLRARALYPNSDGKLKPGQSAKVELKLNTYDNSIVIPSIAMVAEMGRDIAYVYRSGIAREVAVTKGMRTASSVQITEGLVYGDTLITSGVMQLRDGMPVTLSNLVGGE